MLSENYEIEILAEEYLKTKHVKSVIDIGNGMLICCKDGRCEEIIHVVDRNTKQVIKSLQAPIVDLHRYAMNSVKNMPIKDFPYVFLTNADTLFIVDLE